MLLRRSLRPHLLLVLLSLLFSSFASQPARGQSPDAADLAPRYRTWLEDVALLMSPQEKAVFLALKKDYQRDTFMRKFWQVRDPFPQTPQNELEDRWEQRIAIARSRFGGVSDDRAHMLLFNGEPAEVFPVHCDVLLPLEIWTYPGTDRIRGAFSLVFIAHGSSNYKLWYPNDGLFPLLSAARGAGGQSDPRLPGHRRAVLAGGGHLLAARRGAGLAAGGDHPEARPHSGRGVALHLLLLRHGRPGGRRDLPGPGGHFLPRPLRQPHGGAGPRDRAPGGRQAGAHRGQPHGELRLHRRRRGAQQGRAVRALPLSLRPARIRGDGRKNPPGLPALPAARKLLPGAEDRGHGGQELLPRAARAGRAGGDGSGIGSRAAFRRSLKPGNRRSGGSPGRGQRHPGHGGPVRRSGPFSGRLGE